MRLDCLLAAAYPGIPSDFLDWTIEIKQAWAANIPYTIAELNYQRSLLDPRSPHGVYLAVLARTENPELAEKAKNDAAMAERVESLKHEKLA